MPTQWFTKKPNEERKGPFTSKELKQLALSGKLLPTDLVWREGMAKALPASNVQGLFNVQQFPPPLEQPLVDPNNLDALIAGLVPTQQAAYKPNSAAVAETGKGGGEGRRGRCFCLVSSRRPTRSALL